MRGLGVVRVLVVAGAGSAMVWGATGSDARVDLSRAGDTRATSAVSTQSLTRSELVCPGPDRPGVAGSGSAQQTVAIQTASLPPTLLPPDDAGSRETGEVSATRLPGSAGDLVNAVTSRGGFTSTPVSGAGSVDIVGSAGLAPGLAALQVNDDRTATAQGLAMMPCPTTSTTSYLLAGGPQPGRLERIVLSNPSPNAVVARLSVLGAGKPQEVSVPARSRTVALLGEIDDTSPAPVVKVTTTSGTVAVAMADMAFEGTVPQGSELVGPATDPSTDAVIPAGLASGGRVSVRVGVPGKDEAVVRVQVLGPPDANVPDAVQTVPAGSSGTIDLTGLPLGRYALRVTADVPVVAAAESTTAKGPQGSIDNAWAPTAAPITTIAGTPVPHVPGVKSVLMLSSVGREAHVTVGSTDATGSTTTQLVTVPADGVASVSTGSASAVWVKTGGHAVYGALVLGGGDTKKQPLLSVAPLNPVPVSAKVIDAREGLPQ
ncbi:DUF5719 family protein [Luteipulveratus mongoliensis]|uniref:Secreted protein n=1 Tax=Luteipulveratus mongoliensis TaxID=571913 RepID=A0A0K1JI19_9MICO|nr:DUF5719 family protein [Luteipulveratus mongoliensis]AKU16223.1 hypothetical protein VV02_10710 [Luteipulveratus mongoliensis]